MKALVSVFNQEKALVGAFSVRAFSVIMNLRMELFEALVGSCSECETNAELWPLILQQRRAAARLLGAETEPTRLNIKYQTF